MRNIYVVTHPEATHSIDGIVGGWHDSTLTNLGERQARAIAEELARRLDGSGQVEVVASDLQRARRTAEIVQGRTGGRLRIDPDLREKSYGEAEGRSTSWLKRRQIPLPAEGERLRHDEGIAGAETRWDLARRAYGATARLVTSAAENQIVVTHGGTATLVLAAWIEMPIEAAGRVQFGLDPGGITHLVRNARNHSHLIARLNDVNHLARSAPRLPPEKQRQSSGGLVPGQVRDARILPALPALLPGLRGVVFDVGETLVDETRAWTADARAAAITPFTLMGSLGALIERGEDHRRVWSVLGVDEPARHEPIDHADLYPDALGCLRAAKDHGLVVGIAGNQPEAVETELRRLGFSPDFLASSAAWGVEKPSSQFFARIVAETRLQPESILYVGDRLDNDVFPAREAGMRTGFIRRGPWGAIHARRTEADIADLRLESLAELTLLFEALTTRAN